jgi:hypothetical protein
MREPYETLLAPFYDHPLVGPCLGGDEPDWQALLDVEPYLSSGERVMAEIALAIYNGSSLARVRDLARLDTNLRHRALVALELWCQALP